MCWLQDLVVVVDFGDVVWDEVVECVVVFVELLSLFEVDEGKVLVGWIFGLFGMGSLLLLLWMVIWYGIDGVEMWGLFSWFYVGGNFVVYGGVLLLLFDYMFGMILYVVGWLISWIVFLYVDYC